MTNVRCPVISKTVRTLNQQRYSMPRHSHLHSTPASKATPEPSSLRDLPTAERFQQQSAGVALLIPCLPMICYGHSAIFFQLNFVVHEGTDEEASIEQEMFRLLEQTASRLDGEFEHQVLYHKLKFEDIDGDRYHYRACRSTRSAHVLRKPTGHTNHLKLYLGMGTEEQHPAVFSICVTCCHGTILKRL